MKNTSIISAVLFLLTLPLFTQTSKTSITSGPNIVSSTDQVDTLFSPWNKGGTPGAAVIVIKNGTIIVNKGYGLANIESNKPIDSETKFLLASVTKQFTAMAIMILEERGKLRYDDTLAKYIPEFPSYAKRIAIRHLLNHTAGFPEYDSLFLADGLIDNEWPRSKNSKPSKFEPTAKDALQILTQVKELRFIPGTKWEYSNSGYVILAQIVERISGQTFSEFLQQNIFKPLNMNNTILYDQQRPTIQNVATSYDKKNGTYVDIDYAPQNAVYGEDNIYTTIQDMYKWDQSLYTDKLVRLATLKNAFSSGKLNNGTSIDYGFGWFVTQHHGFELVAHTGSWLGFRTAIFRFPNNRLTIIVLSNCTELSARKLGIQVSDIFLTEN